MLPWVAPWDLQSLIFVLHLENELLSVSKFKPDLYLRYVDDIFCVFRDQSTYEKFFQQLNELHSSLKFTFEIGPKFYLSWMQKSNCH